MLTVDFTLVLAVLAGLYTVYYVVANFVMQALLVAQIRNSESVLEATPTKLSPIIIHTNPQLSLHSKSSIICYDSSDSPNHTHNCQKSNKQCQSSFIDTTKQRTAVKSLYKRQFFNELSDETLVYISTFVPRWNHFRTLVTIGKRWNDIFSIKECINNSGVTHNLRLSQLFYERDARYWRTHFKPLIQTTKKSYVSSLMLIDGAFDFGVHRSSHDNECQRLMLKFYLIFYDRFLALQRRKQLQLLNNSDPLYSDNSPSASLSSSSLYSLSTSSPISVITQRSRSRSTESVDACGTASIAIIRPKNGIDLEQTNDFPLSLKEIVLNSKHQVFDLREMKWVCDVLRYSSGSSPLISWNLSQCALTDPFVTMIADALLNRSHFSTLCRLSLSRNSGITDASIAALLNTIVERCPKCTQLDLSFTRITDKTCIKAGRFYRKFVVSGTSQLRNILWNSTNVTRRGEMRFCELATTQSRKY